MKLAVAFVAFAPAVAAAAGQACIQDPVSLVNPFVGTNAAGYGSGGHFPGAAAPFGLIRASPDTVNIIKDAAVEIPYATGGYNYKEYGRELEVTAITHTHMVGAGVLDLGNVGVMPRTSAFTADCLSGRTGKATDCRGGLSHERENATAGYYAAELQYGDSDSVLAEVTATQWTAVHRFTYAADATEGHLFVDMGHALQQTGATHNASVSYDAESNLLTAEVWSDGDYSSRVGGAHIHVLAELPAGVTAFGTWLEGETADGSAASGMGDTAGFYASFAVDGDAPVEMRLGFSLLDDAGAANALATAPTTFDATLAQTQGLWAEQLSALDVCDADAQQDDLVSAYTALYHATLAPTQLTEPDGRYLGFDKEIHTDTERDFYTEMSIWDIHRSQSPLMTLVAPERQRDVLQSLVTMAEQGGFLPKWPMWSGDTGGMEGSHADPMLVDGYLKGVPDVDYETALGYMVDQALNGREEPEAYASLGYLPVDLQSRGPSNTLEYAYDDATIANLACALHGAEDANCTLFTERAGYWRNVFSDGLPCPRDSNGTFYCPSELEAHNPFSNNYAEGDAAQYRWAVMGQPEALVEELGGNETFCKLLNEYFELSVPFLPKIFLPSPFYWGGNEPVLGTVWLFDVAGRPDLTQKWSRKLVDALYSAGPGGLPGNDDYGTMSAWLIFAQSGLYPLTGSGDYLLGSPAFANVTLGPLSITAHDASPDNVYVQRVEMNGEPLEAARFSHADLVAGGGKLEFWMGKRRP